MKKYNFLCSSVPLFLCSSVPLFLCSSVQRVHMFMRCKRGNIFMYLIVKGYITVMCTKENKNEKGGSYEK